MRPANYSTNYFQKLFQIFTDHGIKRGLKRILFYLQKPQSMSWSIFGKKTLVRKVKREKEKYLRLGYVYQHQPLVSFVIQSFNHKENIDLIIKRLRITGDYEIIVCEDGSVDGSWQKWLSLLRRPNDFVIRSNDLGELRASDRALRMARGEFVVFLQDDSIPPANGCWIDQAIFLFKKFPKLIVLGGNGACSKWQDTPQSVKPKYLARDDLPFEFVSWAGADPMFFRRNEVLEIGSTNIQYSGLGEAGIEADVEIGLRAWMSGFQVGFINLDFHRSVGGQGSTIFGVDVKNKRQDENFELIFGTYKDKKSEIFHLVNEANRLLSQAKK